MATSNESTEARVSRLENICALQQQLIDLLGVTARTQQGALESLARRAGVELEQTAAAGTPFTTLN